MAPRRSFSELHNAHRRAVRSRSEIIEALDLGLVTIWDVLGLAAASPHSPLRKIKVKDLLAGEKYMSERDRRRVVMRYAEFSDIDLKNRPPKTDKVVDGRRAGNGVIALVEAMSFTVDGPPSPRFPFDMVPTT
jgi:hypothetical protein